MTDLVELARLALDAMHRGEGGPQRQFVEALAMRVAAVAGFAAAGTEPAAIWISADGKTSPSGQELETLLMSAPGNLVLLTARIAAMTTDAEVKAAAASLQPPRPMGL